MLEYVKNLWFTISLKKKLGAFAAMVILVMGVSVAFNLRIMNFSLDSFNVILQDNSRCHDFQEALELEVSAFESYVRSRTQERREEYVLACVRTKRCLLSLPFSYSQIGQERYARTWNLRNGYEATAQPGICFWKWTRRRTALCLSSTGSMPCSLTFRPMPGGWCRPR